MNNEQTSTAPIARKPQRHDFTEQFIEPFSRLRGEVDRLFEALPGRLPSLRFDRAAAIAAPALEMTEADKAYKITAELPGIDPADVDVTVEDGMLRIAGEKKEEREANERGYRFSERSYGRFERYIELPAAADGDGITATFKNGLLSISIPKSGDAEKQPRKIAVATA